VDDHPIEQCPYAANYFDVVVMINVLDHVMDAQLCLATATRITKPGGLLVIGQDLTNEEDLKKIPFDIGHPIRLRLEDVESQLIGFSPVLRKVLPRAASRNPDAHYATLIFAGRKDTYLARK
jgi:ubiquinone/menaquinone biosynthesis C-methylase UbiE